MLSQHIYQNRADRVIAVGRAILCGFATIAVVVDPPPRLAQYVLETVSAYLALSVVLALWLWRRPTTARPIGTWAIASDIAVFTALVYTTADGSSPFFTMLLFIILSATLKWKWRGALYVGATVLVLFLPTGLSLPFFGPSPGNETMRFVMRVGNLIVLSGLLIYFGAQREKAWAASVDAERARLSRDLHDGILQFLSGLSLQLRVVEAEVARDPEAAQARFARLRDSLVAEQRELRDFVTDFARPRVGSVTANDLAGLGRLLSNHWDVEIVVETGGEFDAGSLAGDVRQIVRESVANAVRHGGATLVSIRARRAPGGIELDIGDNGSGFAQAGVFDIRQMRAEGLGPKSLRERVAQLGGALVAESGDSGLRLAIRLPIDRKEAA